MLCEMASCNTLPDHQLPIHLSKISGQNVSPVLYTPEDDIQNSSDTTDESDSSSCYNIHISLAVEVNEIDLAISRKKPKNKFKCRPRTVPFNFTQTLEAQNALQTYEQVSIPIEMREGNLMQRVVTNHSKFHSEQLRMVPEKLSHDEDKQIPSIVQSRLQRTNFTTSSEQPTKESANCISFVIGNVITDTSKRNVSMDGKGVLYHQINTMRNDQNNTDAYIMPEQNIKTFQVEERKHECHVSITKKSNSEIEIECSTDRDDEMPEANYLDELSEDKNTPEGDISGQKNVETPRENTFPKTTSSLRNIAWPGLRTASGDVGKNINTTQSEWRIKRIEEFERVLRRAMINNTRQMKESSTYCNSDNQRLETSVWGPSTQSNNEIHRNEVIEQRPSEIANTNTSRCKVSEQRHSTQSNNESHRNEVIKQRPSLFANNETFRWRETEHRLSTQFNNDRQSNEVIEQRPLPFTNKETQRSRVFEQRPSTQSNNERHRNEVIGQRPSSLKNNETQRCGVSEQGLSTLSNNERHTTEVVEQRPSPFTNNGTCRCGENLHRLSTQPNNETHRNEVTEQRPSPFTNNGTCRCGENLHRLSTQSNNETHRREVIERRPSPFTNNGTCRCGENLHRLSTQSNNEIHRSEVIEQRPPPFTNNDTCRWRESEQTLLTQFNNERHRNEVIEQRPPPFTNNETQRCGVSEQRPSTHFSNKRYRNDVIEQRPLPFTNNEAQMCGVCEQFPSIHFNNEGHRNEVIEPRPSPCTNNETQRCGISDQRPSIHFNNERYRSEVIEQRPSPFTNNETQRCGISEQRFPTNSCNERHRNKVIEQWPSPFMNSQEQKYDTFKEFPSSLANNEWHLHQFSEHRPPTYSSKEGHRQEGFEQGPVTIANRERHRNEVFKQRYSTLTNNEGPRYEISKQRSFQLTDERQRFPLCEQRMHSHVCNIESGEVYPNHTRSNEYKEIITDEQTSLPYSVNKIGALIAEENSLMQHKSMPNKINENNLAICMEGKVFTEPKQNLQTCYNNNKWNKEYKQNSLQYKKDRHSRSKSEIDIKIIREPTPLKYCISKSEECIKELHDCTLESYNEYTKQENTISKSAEYCTATQGNCMNDKYQYYRHPYHSPIGTGEKQENRTLKCSPLRTKNKKSLKLSHSLPRPAKSRECTSHSISQFGSNVHCLGRSCSEATVESSHKRNKSKILACSSSRNGITSTPSEYDIEIEYTGNTLKSPLRFEREKEYSVLESKSRLEIKSRKKQPKQQNIQILQNKNCRKEEHSPSSLIYNIPKQNVRLNRELKLSKQEHSYSKLEGVRECNKMKLNIARLESNTTYIKSDHNSRIENDKNHNKSKEYNPARCEINQKCRIAECKVTKMERNTEYTKSEHFSPRLKRDIRTESYLKSDHSPSRVEGDKINNKTGHKNRWLRMDRDEGSKPSKNHLARLERYEQHRNLKDSSPISERDEENPQSGNRLERLKSDHKYRKHHNSPSRLERDKRNCRPSEQLQSWLGKDKNDRNSKNILSRLERDRKHSDSEDSLSKLKRNRKLSDSEHSLPISKRDKRYRKSKHGSSTLERNVRLRQSNHSSLWLEEDRAYRESEHNLSNLENKYSSSQEDLNDRESKYISTKIQNNRKHRKAHYSISRLVMYRTYTHRKPKHSSAEFKTNNEHREINHSPSNFQDRCNYKGREPSPLRLEKERKYQTFNSAQSKLDKNNECKKSDRVSSKKIGVNTSKTAKMDSILKRDREYTVVLPNSKKSRKHKETESSSSVSNCNAENITSSLTSKENEETSNSFESSLGTHNSTSSALCQHTGLDEQSKPRKTIKCKEQVLNQEWNDGHQESTNNKVYLKSKKIEKGIAIRQYPKQSKRESLNLTEKQSEGKYESVTGEAALTLFRPKKNEDVPKQSKVTQSHSKDLLRLEQEEGTRNLVNKTHKLQQNTAVQPQNVTRALMINNSAIIRCNHIEKQRFSLSEKSTISKPATIKTNSNSIVSNMPSFNRLRQLVKLTNKPTPESKKNITNKPLLLNNKHSEPICNMCSRKPTTDLTKENKSWNSNLYFSSDCMARRRIPEADFCSAPPSAEDSSFSAQSKTTVVLRDSTVDKIRQDNSYPTQSSSTRAVIESTNTDSCSLPSKTNSNMLSEDQKDISDTLTSETHKEKKCHQKEQLVCNITQAENANTTIKSNNLKNVQKEAKQNLEDCISRTTYSISNSSSDSKKDQEGKENLVSKLSGTFTRDLKCFVNSKLRPYSVFNRAKTSTNSDLPRQTDTIPAHTTHKDVTKSSNKLASNVTSQNVNIKVSKVCTIDSKKPNQNKPFKKDKESTSKNNITIKISQTRSQSSAGKTADTLKQSSTKGLCIEASERQNILARKRENVASKTQTIIDSKLTGPKLKLEKKDARTISLEQKTSNSQQRNAIQNSYTSSTKEKSSCTKKNKSQKTNNSNMTLTEKNTKRFLKTQKFPQKLESYYKQPPQTTSRSETKSSNKENCSEPVTRTSTPPTSTGTQSCSKMQHSEPCTLINISPKVPRSHSQEPEQANNKTKHLKCPIETNNTNCIKKNTHPQKNEDFSSSETINKFQKSKSCTKYEITYRTLEENNHDLQQQENKSREIEITMQTSDSLSIDSCVTSENNILQKQTVPIELDLPTSKQKLLIINMSEGPCKGHIYQSKYDLSEIEEELSTDSANTMQNENEQDNDETMKDILNIHLKDSKANIQLSKYLVKHRSYDCLLESKKLRQITHEYPKEVYCSSNKPHRQLMATSSSSMLEVKNNDRYFRKSNMYSSRLSGEIIMRDTYPTKECESHDDQNNHDTSKTHFNWNENLSQINSYSNQQSSVGSIDTDKEDVTFTTSHSSSSTSCMRSIQVKPFQILSKTREERTEDGPDDISSIQSSSSGEYFKKKPTINQFREPLAPQYHHNHQEKLESHDKNSTFTSPQLDNENSKNCLRDRQINNCFTPKIKSEMNVENKKSASPPPYQTHDVEYKRSMRHFIPTDLMRYSGCKEELEEQKCLEKNCKPSRFTTPLHRKCNTELQFMNNPLVMPPLNHRSRAKMADNVNVDQEEPQMDPAKTRSSNHKYPCQTVHVEQKKPMRKFLAMPPIQYIPKPPKMPEEQNNNKKSNKAYNEQRKSVSYPSVARTQSPEYRASVHSKSLSPLPCKNKKEMYGLLADPHEIKTYKSPEYQGKQQMSSQLRRDELGLDRANSEEMKSCGSSSTKSESTDKSKLQDMYATSSLQQTKPCRKVLCSRIPHPLKRIVPDDHVREDRYSRKPKKMAAFNKLHIT